VARVATAKKSAAVASTSGATETRSRSQAKPGRSTRVAKQADAGVRSQPIEPVVNEREESTLEFEFMEAMQQYKQSSGRMFPTWSEVLEVLHSLGYRKPGQDATALNPELESPET
jgi:hypothetical protein